MLYTRVDNALINANTFTETTDNIATIREIIVNDSATNLMGGFNADNAIFTSDAGTIGIQAPNIDVQLFASVGDFDATGTALPQVHLGAGSTIGSFNIRGGDLVQTNGNLISFSGFSALLSTEGTTSRSVELPRVEIDTSVFDTSGGGSITLITMPTTDPPGTPPTTDPGDPPGQTPPPPPG